MSCGSQQTKSQQNSLNLKMVKFLLISTVFLLYIISCGGFVIQSRIINGVKSDVRQYPFYVHLRSYKGQMLGQCGASLLNDR